MSVRMQPSGYFGKLPLRGDFIQRNLNAEFISLWDEWLQKMINNSRISLAEHWLEHYLVSPVWHFFLTLETGHQYTGIMLPSVDKVGRYFPFTLACLLPKKTTITEFLNDHHTWYERAEYIAIQALEENLDYEQLNQAIDNLVLIESEEQPYNLEKNSGAYRVSLNENTSLDTALNLIQAKMAAPTAHMTSYWWTRHEEDNTGDVICCFGLPNESIYNAMLNGNWEMSHINNLDASL